MRFEGHGPILRRAIVLLCLPVFSVGCASPGAPKPPSLNLPEPVRDLSAARSGNQVQIRFTGPSRTTDGLVLRGAAQAVLCRQSGPGEPCAPVHPAETPAAAQRLPLTVQPDEAVLLTDSLPPPLATGPVRLLAYRLELRNEAGHSAGNSDPVYVAAGQAPPQIEDLRAEGTRPGVLLRWSPVAGAGEILLERRQIDPPPATDRRSAQQGQTATTTARATRSDSRNAVPQTGAHGQPVGQAGLVTLQAEPGNAAAAETVDGTVSDGVRYRYIAVRRIIAKVGARALELRSASSTPVETTWRDVYPPVAPRELTALGFTAPPSSAPGTSAYAVDLIWQPVNDPRVTGYLVRRTALSTSGEPHGATERLSSEPVTTPGFHDPTALPSVSYRYDVVATDAKGNLSPAATAVVRALPR